MKIQAIDKLLSFNGKVVSPKDSESKQIPNSDNKKGTKALLGPLAGLAVIGMAVGLKMTSKNTFEDALKKSGVQMKDGIATIIDTGEKFTGKITRYETRNRKETVDFVDGKMTEKLYHNFFGKELEGYFYKNNEPVLRVAKSSSTLAVSCLGKNESCVTRMDVKIERGESAFDWARNYLKDKK